LIRKELDNGLAVQFFFEGIAPIIAEKLGDSWKQDIMTFSEVTIAVSKLRLLCQELESIYLEPEEPLKSAPKILLFTDGGSGANEDVAMVIYNEGGSAEGDYSGELTLANILESTTISTLTHDNFWG